jgi:hypothetical protein
VFPQGSPHPSVSKGFHSILVFDGIISKALSWHGSADSLDRDTKHRRTFIVQETHQDKSVSMRSGHTRTYGGSVTLVQTSWSRPHIDLRLVRDRQPLRSLVALFSRWNFRPPRLDSLLVRDSEVAKKK